MALSNLLADRVFNALFREVFSGDLGDRSEDLVEEIRAFMQRTLETLCDRACPAYPVLLDELKGNLVEEFIDARETETKAAVRNLIEAELDWVYTQDPWYEDTMRRVYAMVNYVRENKVERNGMTRLHRLPALVYGTDVGNVPGHFISKMVERQTMSEEDAIRDLQVTKPPLVQGGRKVFVT